MKIYQGSSGKALTPEQYKEEMEGPSKKRKLDPEKVEIEKAIQSLSTDLALDLSQNIYYSAAEKKFNDKIIRAQLKQWLFDHFPTENPLKKNLRDSVATEVLGRLSELQKEEPMPKEWEKFNDKKITLLTRAIVNVSAEVVVRGDDNSEFKLKMLRSFLNIDSTN